MNYDIIIKDEGVYQKVIFNDITHFADFIQTEIWFKINESESEAFIGTKQLTLIHKWADQNNLSYEQY